MKTETKKTHTTPTTLTKEIVTDKLRDISLDDLDIVTGGAKCCDNNVQVPQN